jgi:hypothetical protein
LFPPAIRHRLPPGLSFKITRAYKPIAFRIRGDHMAKKAKRRAWEASDIRELKSLARTKTPAGKIAKKLKRSEGATRQKAFSMGLSLDSRA